MRRKFRKARESLHSSSHRSISSIELQDLKSRGLTEPLKRPHLTLRQFLTLVVVKRGQAELFSSIPPLGWIVMITILANVIMIGLETGQSVRERHGAVFDSIDLVFLSIYTMEFVLHMYVDPKSYWSSSYRILDFLLLLLAYFQVGILLSCGVSIELKRIVRASKVFRILKSISWVRPLQVIVHSLLKTIADIFNLFFLLFLFIFVFSFIGYYLFGYDGVLSYWSTLSRSMFTLAIYVTADGWTDVQEQLDNYGVVASRFFTIVFIFIGSFIFTNLFIGIVIQNLDETTRQEKARQKERREHIFEAKMQAYMEHRGNDISSLLERQRRTNLSVDEILSHAAGKLRHDDMVAMHHMSAEAEWLEAYLAALDQQENAMFRCQQTHFELANTVAEMVDQSLQSKLEDCA